MDFENEAQVEFQCGLVAAELLSGVMSLVASIRFDFLHQRRQALLCDKFNANSASFCPKL